MSSTAQQRPLVAVGGIIDCLLPLPFQPHSSGSDEHPPPAVPWGELTAVEQRLFLRFFLHERNVDELRSLSADSEEDLRLQRAVAAARTWSMQPPYCSRWLDQLHTTWASLSDERAEQLIARAAEFAGCTADDVEAPQEEAKGEQDGEVEQKREEKRRRVEASGDTEQEGIVRPLTAIRSGGQRIEGGDEG